MSVKQNQNISVATTTWFTLSTNTSTSKEVKLYKSYSVSENTVTAFDFWSCQRHRGITCRISFPTFNQMFWNANLHIQCCSLMDFHYMIRNEKQKLKSVTLIYTYQLKKCCNWYSLPIFVYPLSTMDDVIRRKITLSSKRHKWLKQIIYFTPSLISQF